MPRYITGGETYDIPKEEISAFEAQYPDATIELYDGEDTYDIPLTKKQEFIERYPNASTTPPPKMETLTPSPTPMEQIAIEQGWGKSAMPIEEMPAPQPQPHPNSTIAQVRKEIEAKKQAKINALPTPDTDKIVAEMKGFTTPSQNAYQQKMDEVDEINKAEKFGAITSQEADIKRKSLMIGDALSMANKPSDATMRRVNAEQVGDALKTTSQKIDSLIAADPYAPYRNNRNQYDTYAAAKHALTEAQNIIEEADKAINAGNYTTWQKRNVAKAGRGAADKLFDARSWDMGLKDMEETLLLKKAVDKADNGEELTEAERLLLDAKAIELATNAYFGSHLSTAYKAGQGAVDSIIYSLDFVINPMSAVGKSTQSKLVRYALKNFSKGLVSKKLKTKALAYGGRVAADLGGSLGMTLTTGLPRTIADMQSRKAGDIQPTFNERGEAQYGGRENVKSAGRSAYEAITAGTLERFSEHGGDYTAPLTSALGKLGAKVLPNKMVDATKALIADANKVDLYRHAKDLVKKTQWHGVAGEYGEEFFNNVANAALVGDLDFFERENPKEGEERGKIVGLATDEGGVFDPKMNWETLCSVALTGGAMSTFLTGAYSTGKYQAYRNVNIADRQAGRAFGSDWGGIKSTLKSADDNAVEALKKIQADPEITPEQKKAAAKYTIASFAKFGAEMGDIKMKIDPTIPAEQIELQTSYDVGRSLTTTEDMQDAEMEYQAAANKLREMFMLGKNGDVDTLLGENAVDDILGSLEIGGSMEEAQAKLDYLNAKAKRDGMMDNIKDQAREQINAANEQIALNVNKESGTIQHALVRDGGEGRSVFIVSGDVKLLDDGSIDLENSSHDIIVRDEQTGKLEMSTPDKLASAQVAQDVNEFTQQVDNDIRERVAAEASNKINGTLPMENGDVYNIADEKGTPHQVTVMNNNGDGTALVSIDGAEAVNMPTESIQAMADAYRIAQRAETKAQQEQAEREAFEEMDREASEQEAQAKAKEQEITQPATSSIPVDENGNRQYTQVDADTAWNGLMEQTEGDAEMAMIVANAMKSKAEKALEKVKKEEVAKGNTPEEMISAMKAHKEKVAKAQAEVDKWNDIATTPQRRAEQARLDAEKEANAAKMQAIINDAVEKKAEQEQAETTPEVQEQDVQNEGEAQNNAEEVAEPAPQKPSPKEVKKAKALIKRINDWAKVLNVEPVIYNSVEEVESPQARKNIKEGKLVTGWYENGKIYFYLPNLRDVSDVNYTAIHETVAHHGMEAMLGKEAYRDLCKRIYDEVMTDAQRKEFLDYVRKNEPVKGGATEGKATYEEKIAIGDEFMAFLAEETYVEHSSAYDKIASFVRKALRAVGFDVKLSGEELRDLLRQSYQNLESGNAEATTGEHRARISRDIERDYPNWIEGTTTDSGKHTTQVEGTRKTYNKVGDWIEENLGNNVSILDASSGMGYGTADLRERGFNIEDVEPYQSEDRKKNNPATFSSYDDIDKQYDFIISNAVLNVIPDDWRSDVLHNMADKLKQGGKLFINTRKAGEEKAIKDKIELDTPQEVLVKRNGEIASYQRFFTPTELKEWVESELGDGYSVEIANQKNSGTKGLAAVVVTKEGVVQNNIEEATTSKPQMQEKAEENAESTEKNIEEVTESANRIEEEGGQVDVDRGDVRFAVRDVLIGEKKEQAIKDITRVTGRSRKTVLKYLKAEESLANIILNGDNEQFLDLQVDESVPSIWENSDYPQGTVEFSNICRKRLPFTMIYQQLQKDYPNTVFDASTLESIRGVLKDNGIEVACGLCFVEDRRQHLGEIGQGFIDALNGKEITNEGQKEAIARVKASGDSYIPNLYELLTLDGMKELRREHPEIANAFIRYNSARGQGAGRLFQAYSAYHREILDYDQKRVNKINNSGGLRIFSFSDFEAHHLIDLVQVLTDCAAKGVKVQGYTKVPEFAYAVKGTKMKLNRSLIAKDSGIVDADYVPQQGEAVSPNVIGGKRLLLDTVEGIDVNHKDFFDSSSSKNVGNILVGINDEQIRLAMADPFVDYIIPFHTGIKKDVLKKKGIDTWKNYKLEQIEHIRKVDGTESNADKHGINIHAEVLSDDIKTEKQFVEKYLEVCKEKGWLPKFHRFLEQDKNGEFKYTKGYYKLLLDFKLFDKRGRILPQEVVEPIFDNEFNKQILEDYVAGEKVKAPNAEIYEQVKEALADEGKIRFSVRGNKEIEQIIAEAKSNGTYLKAPNGADTNLTPKQWAMVRTKAFKNWFGDWEKAARIEKLRNSKSISISGYEIVITGDFKLNKSNAIEYGKTLTGNYVNKDTGKEVRLTSSKKNGGLYEILQHNYKDVEHIQSIAAIPQIIEESIYIDTISNEDMTKHPNVLSYDYYVCGLNIGGEEYTVKAVVSNMSDGSRYYDHKLTNIEKGRLIDMINKAPESSVSISTQTPESSAFSKSKDKRLELIIQTNSSKIVDANGEPKVVYHQTNATQYINVETGENWDDLDWRAKMEWDERDDWDEHWQEQDFNEFSRVNARVTNEFDGFFFAPEYDEYHEYGKRTIEAFLNIRKPASNADYNIDSTKNEAGREERIRLQGEGYDGVIREYDGVVDEYIAFEPNQIKSATDNVGAFDAGNNDIRFRFIGEKGASNLDAAEEATTRLDNLAIARQMEEANKDAKTIKMATGWERGADGLWRYEVEDEITAKIIRGLKGVGVKKIHEARSKRIKDLDKYAYILNVVGIDRLYNDNDIQATSWSDAQKQNWLDIYNTYKDDREKAIEHYRKLRSEISKLTSFGKGEFMLYEALGADHPLFKEYPQMRDIKLLVKPYKGGTYTGGFNRLSNTIEIVDFRGIFENDKGEGTANTLAHEIQHIIQGVEGFARGGNASMEDPRKAATVKAQTAEYEESLHEDEAELRSLYQHQEDINLQMKSWWDAHPEANWEEALSDKSMEDLNNQYMETQTKINDTRERVSRYRSIIEEIESVDTTLGLEGYKRLAGEVEARNVERRRNMPMAERRSSLALETEDVARQDQIFLENALGENSIRFRIADYKAEFSNLQSEYDALDKTDAVALNAWRDKKVGVVRGYLESVAKRFGMKPEIIVFNGADEAQMQEAYQRLVESYKRTGNTPPAYEAFKEHSLNKKVGATYRVGGNIITVNVSHGETKGAEKYSEYIFHEDTHHLVYSLYSKQEMAEIWDVVKDEKYAFVKRINNSPLYKDKQASSKGNEFVAFSVGWLASDQKRLFLQFIKGENGVTAEDVVKKLKYKQRKANFAVAEILNLIKYEYEESRNQRAEDNLVGGVGNDGLLSDNRGGVEDDAGRRIARGVDTRGGSGSGLLVTPEQKAFFDAVAQNGFAKTVGYGSYDAFLDKAYRVVPKNVRDAIADRAKHIGWDFRAATKEYLASLAGNNNQEAVDAIRKPFEEMTRKANISDSFSDNDLRYMLWRNNQMQKSKGAIAVAEDVVMKQKLGVGNYEVADQPTSPTLFRIVTPSTGEARAYYDQAVRRSTKRNKLKATDNLAHRLEEAYFDSMVSVRHLMEGIRRETGAPFIKDNADVYTAENRLSSTNKAQIEAWERDYFAPLMSAVCRLIDKGATYDEIKEYIYAKSGLERNEVFSQREAEKNGGQWDGTVKRDFSGLTELTGEATQFTDAAQQIVDEFESKYHTSDLWMRINDATNATLKKGLDSGMISKDAYDKLSSMFKYYVPLQGWANNAAANEFEYMGSSNMKILPMVRHANGRTSLAEDPLATIGSKGESAIIQGNRNLMKQKLLNLATEYPTSLLTVSEQWYTQVADGTWRPEPPIIPEDATAEEVAAILSQHEADMIALGDKAKKQRNGLELDLHTTRQEAAQHAVKVMRNGKEYIVYVNGNPTAAQAINGFTNPNTPSEQNWVDSFMKGADYVKNFMARSFTSYNPAFVVTNFSRDVIFASTAVAIKEDASYTKQYTKNISEVILKAKMPQLVSKWQDGKLDMNVPLERFFNEFMLNGGETGYTQLNSVDDYKKKMQRLIKEAQGGAVATSQKIVRAGLDFVEFMNRSVEDTTRFAVYLTSRQQGRSIARSIDDAKNITVNFNRKGRGNMGAGALGYCYIFFNAAMQSMSNLGKLIKEHPVKSTVAISSFGVAGMLFPLVTLAMQALLGDDDEPTYWDLPEWVRRNNIVLGCNGVFVTIPLPHELRPFYGMGEIALSVLAGKEKVEDGLRKAVAGFAGMLPIDPTGNAGDLVTNLTPTVAQPIVQVLKNRDYFGLPIYRDTPFNKNDPEWTKAYKGTSALLINGTRLWNEAMGGDDVTSAAIKAGGKKKALGWLMDVNPGVIEHLLEGYLGGMGKTFSQTYKMFEMIWNEDTRNIRNVPVISSFIKIPDERSIGGDVNNQYYDAVQEARWVEEQERKYRKHIRMGASDYAEKLNELLQSPLYQRYKVIMPASDKVSDKQKMLKEADVTNPDSVEQVIYNLKEEMLRELQELENKQSDKSNK